eukprot:CAMPEP_0194499938 /NCGR_PEP_ID=MMETSP0253-20130528/16082_1 /TAXON_ID=2966 /ORGANISM="Noctiluca scintillans" /LENGTH=90 /DNA_ID=CAMNT_0039341741 /DNA_START=83 /DNA_END=352 /DNA_ORIENTATION=+
MADATEDLTTFAAVRAVIEDRMHQEYMSFSTRDLPARMRPRREPTFDPEKKVEWEDWKKWDWLQPGWKGPKMHIITSINEDESAEIRSAW